MKLTSIFLALLGLYTGLVAAWRWYQSSKVAINPGWNVPGSGMEIGPVTPILQRMDMESAAMRAHEAIGRLNQAASLWTAASVLFNASAAVIGSFS